MPLATVLALFAAPLQATQATLADTATRLPVDPAIHIDTLPNGIISYVRLNREPQHRAELRLAINAGAVLEDDDQLGLAHVVEHMAFNGTRRFPQQTLVDHLERLGMRFGPHINAFTSFDETVYQLRVPTDTAGALERGLDILEDWASGVTFDSAEVEKERGVVIEEWRLGLGADDRIFKRQMPELLRGSRYAERPVIGSEASLRGFTRDRLLRFYRDWYRPELMAVMAVGDFDSDSVREMIRARFGRLPRAAAPRPRVEQNVILVDSTRAVVATDPELPYTTVTLALRAPQPAEGTIGAFRHDLAATLAEIMINARLAELSQRPDPPFAVAALTRANWVRSAQFLMLGAGVGDEGSERGLEAVLIEAERARRHGFTDTELARARADLLRAYERAWRERETTHSATHIGRYQDHFLAGAPIPPASASYSLADRLLPAIGVAEVNAVAQGWLRSRDRVLLVSAPDKPGLTPPTEADLLDVVRRVNGLEIAAYEDLVSDAPLVSSPPEPGRIVSARGDSAPGLETWTLSNGVRVLLKPTDFKADEVLFTAYSPGGTSLSSDADFLSAWLSSQLVGLGGLGEYDQVALEKKLAGRVAAVAPSISTTQEGLSGRASPSDLDLLFELIYLTMTAPRADGPAFQAFLTNAEAALANRAGDPDAAFADTLQVTLSQHHPRSRPVTPALLDSLDLAVAYRFYRERFADAGDFTFVFVGAFEVDSLRPLVERWLGGLPAGGREERWRDPGIRPPRGVVERTVRRGLEPRSTTRIVFTGPVQPTRGVRAALRALSGVMDIRLRENLRESLGGTYGAGTGVSVAHEPTASYAFSVGFGSAPERADELVQVTFAIIDSLRSSGPRADDLLKVRENEARSRQTALRQNGYWLSALSLANQRGEDLVTVADPRGDADLMTAEAVHEAARRYLDPANYIRVTLLPEVPETE